MPTTQPTAATPPRRYTASRATSRSPSSCPAGAFFGTLCAIDPRPHRLDKPEVIGSFHLFAELIAFHIDATQRLAAAEATLVRERQLSELREQFIAVLGHDLRNPLAAIDAAARLIERNPTRVPKLAPQISQSVARMAGLIDNVLDLTRGRLGGGIAIAPIAAPLAPALSQVIEELRSTHPQRQIDVDFDLTHAVACDHARIAQMLSNLLGNALTHGAAGAPVLVHASTSSTTFTLSVTNAGPPIPPETLPSLFEPFFRGADRESSQGLGLGLYIAAEIARAHHGAIEVVSTQAETRFTFRMPTDLGALPS